MVYKYKPANKTNESLWDKKNIYDDVILQLRYY